MCVLIHTVKGVSVITEAEVDFFFSGILYDPTDADNLISGSSAFSKSSLNIWKFSIHILLNPGLENCEHYFASVWDGCNWVLDWTLFGIAFLWDCILSFLVFFFYYLNVTTTNFKPSCYSHWYIALYFYWIFFYSCFTIFIFSSMATSLQLRQNYPCSGNRLMANFLVIWIYFLKYRKLYSPQVCS